MLPRRTKPRVEPVLQRLLKSLNGNRRNVTLHVRSGLSFEEAVAKDAQIHSESVAPIDDYFDSLQAQFDAARGVEIEPVRKSLPEPDAFATISFVVEEF